MADESTGEKTEKPSAKKLKDARGKGQVVRSKDLVVAAAAGDIEAMVRPAHSMKSSSLNVGALELGALCRALEEDARGGTVDDPVGRANAIKLGFAEARAALLEEGHRR